MHKKPSPQQTELEMVTLESLVPCDHLFRKIDAVIDFSFIHDRVADLYCADNGRPAQRCRASSGGRDLYRPGLMQVGISRPLQVRRTRASASLGLIGRAARFGGLAFT